MKVGGGLGASTDPSWGPAYEGAAGLRNMIHHYSMNPKICPYHKRRIHWARPATGGRRGMKHEVDSRHKHLFDLVVKHIHVLPPSFLTLENSYFEMQHSIANYTPAQIHRLPKTNSRLFMLISWSYIILIWELEDKNHFQKFVFQHNFSSHSNVLLK